MKKGQRKRLPFLFCIVKTLVLKMREAAT